MLKLKRFLSADPKVIGLGVAGCVCLLKLAGVFEGSEFYQLNWMFRHRPTEASDERIVVVGQTEEDIQKLGAQTLSDRTLYKLLSEILKQKPRAVGLDFIRDLPEPAKGATAKEAEENLDKLRQLLAQTPNLYVVAKVTGNEAQRVPPPPGVEPKRVGDISLPLEKNGVQRRQVLLAKQRDEQGKIETFVNSLALHLAFAYLEEEDANLKITEMPRGWLGQDYFKLGRGTFPLDLTRLGFEILINWRNPPSSFKSVTVTDVLEGKVAPDLFTDRVVLLGSMAISKGDRHNTPYLTAKSGNVIYGVELIANVTSQVISAALEGRPNLRLLPDSIEYAVIFLSSIFSAGIVAYWHKRKDSHPGILWKTAIVGGGGVLLVAVTSYVIFLEGLLYPIFPITLAIAGSAVGQGSGIYWREWKKFTQERRERERIQVESVLWERTDCLKNDCRDSIDEAVITLQDLHDKSEIKVKFSQELQEFLKVFTEWQDELEKTTTAYEQGYERVKDRLCDFNKLTLSVNKLQLKIDWESYHPTVVSTADLIDDVVELTEKRLSSELRILTIIKDYNLKNETIEVFVQAVKVALKEVLLNICLIAVQEKLKLKMHKHGQCTERKVLVKIESYHEHIEVTIVNSSKAMMMEKNGEEYEKILLDESFFSTPKNNWLYWVYKCIVEAHKGAIEGYIVDEMLGKFIIRLPKVFRKESSAISLV